ncbi:MAG: Gfo/Idh/MocA family oxidoreductase [Bacteroidales bacterium]|nr:Gfo/Idh/MocA family oxidoreductase [Bacteroidales bacterium]
MSKRNTFSRRTFLGTSLLGVAGLTLIPGCKTAAPSDTLRIGFIGLGRQAMYLMSSFIKVDGVKVVAGSDVYGRKNERFEQRVKAFYEEAGEKTDVKTYGDYRKLLDRKDIDAVVIASPDHWHYHIATEAISSGKDVYLEKPLTFTIAEGQKLVKAVRGNDAILAVGSQQRSDSNFQHAVKMAGGGNLGTLEKVDVFIGANPHPTPYDKPEQDLPADLNWEMWLGPNPYVHFNDVLNPPITLDPPSDEKFWGAWRWYKETGGGLMTDWGAHMFDIAQWGLGMDGSGPVKAIPAGFEENEYLKYIYENGLEMEVKPFNGETRGVKFWGSDGWIEISRDAFNASDESLKPQLEETDVPYEARSGHHQNFIQSVKDHTDPVVPVEVGHRTNTVCVIGNVAHELGRPVEWDAKGETFKSDQEANAFLTRDYNNGYTL